MPVAAQTLLVTANIETSTNLPSPTMQVLAGSHRIVNVNIMTKAGATAYSTTSSITTITAANNFTSTSEVSFTSPSGDALTGLNGVTLPVLATGLSSTQFEVNTGAYIPATGSGATAANAVAQCTAGALTCEVNWSYTATGGGTLTFSDPTHTAVSSIANALPAMGFTVGTTAGSCGISPAMTSAGPYTLSSSVTATITAQLVDDNTKTATFPLLVCGNSGATLANGTSPLGVTPAYVQAFQSQQIDLTSFNTGVSNEAVTWAITSQPTGGNGTLSDTSNRDTVFSATVTGRYQLTATSSINGATGSAIIYVTTTGIPSAGPMADTHAILQPCVVDPAMTGTDYEVGAGKAWADLSTIDPTTIPAGSIIRLWNEDTTGTNPTVYNNYFNITASGTAAQPSYVCGVVDSLNNEPIIDATNATGNTNAVTSLAGYGVIYTYPSGSHFGYWAAGSLGPSYWTIADLHVRNARGSSNFIPQHSLLSSTYTGGGSFSGTGVCNVSYSVGYPAPTGTITVTSGTPSSGITITNEGNGVLSAPTTATVSTNTATCSGTISVSSTAGPGSAMAWNSGAAGVYLGSGTYNSLRGMDIDNNATGVYGLANGNNAWATITQYTDVFGNYVRGSGVSGSSLSHQMYIEGFFNVIEQNYFDSYTSGASGSNIKTRGIENIIRYNAQASGSNTARDVDMVEVQDAPAYVDFITLLSGTSSSAIPMDVIAGYQESYHKDFVYGNAINNTSTGDVFQVHYFEDHSGLMAARTGDLYFYSNTMPSSAQVFDTSYGGYSATGYFQPEIHAQNNIFWARNTTGVSSKLVLPLLQSVFMDNVTNLYETGTMVITTPITGGNYNAGGATGFGNQCDGNCPWPITSPQQTHYFDLTSANYLLTSTLPYNSSTFIPVSGSAAIGAASAISGAPALLPARYEYNLSTGLVSARSSSADIGAMQSGGTPSLTSIAVAPTTASIVVGGTQTYVATCYYSDGSNANCTGSVTWASSSTAVATMSGAIATGVATGTSNITASYLGVTSPNSVLTVTGASSSLVASPEMFLLLP